MQTFLPYPDFWASARTLDRRRLGKQRVEALQILHVLLDEHSGWRAHPAVIMWCGAEPVLVQYGLVVCTVWREYGYRDSCFEQFLEIGKRLPDPWIAPWWIGEDLFHRTHRSNLLRKDPKHYRQFWPCDPDDLPYFWPIDGAPTTGAGDEEPERTPLRVPLRIQSR